MSDLWSCVNNYHHIVPRINWMKSRTHLRKQTTLWIIASASPLHLAMVLKANGTQARETCAKAFTRIKHQENLRSEKAFKHHSKRNLHHWQEQYFGLMYIQYIFGCLRISIVLSKTLWVQFFVSLDLIFFSMQSPFHIKAMLKLWVQCIENAKPYGWYSSNSLTISNALVLFFHNIHHSKTNNVKQKLFQPWNEKLREF